MVSRLPRGDGRNQDRRRWKGGVTRAGRTVRAIALAEEGYGVHGLVTVGGGTRDGERALAAARAIVPVVGGRAVGAHGWPCIGNLFETAERDRTRRDKQGHEKREHGESGRPTASAAHDPALRLDREPPRKKQSSNAISPTPANVTIHSEGLTTSSRVARCGA